MQYPIHIVRWWRPWLLLFGVTQQNTFAEVEKKSLRLRFGLAQYEVDVGDVESVGTYHWPSWAGVGWLPNLAGSIALIGSPGKVVEIRLRERKRLGTLGIPCVRLLVSVDEPNQFAEMLGGLIAKPARARSRSPRNDLGGKKPTTPSRSRPSRRGSGKKAA